LVQVSDVLSELPELPKIPEGFYVIAGVGWEVGKEATEERVQAGTLLLPRHFHMLVGRDPHEAPGPFFIAVLYFRVTNADEVRLLKILVDGDLDVPQLLESLTEHFPIEDWTRIAIAQVVLRELRVHLGDAATEYSPDHASRGWMKEYFGQGAVLGAPVTQFQAMEIARQADELATAGQRRARITPKHLEAVASVYRSANEEGLPPTQAVAQHFKTSHSTAARWVGMARKRGLLPPTEPGKGKS